MKQTDKLIQSKLKDFELDVPETLWANIESRLPGSKHIIPLWKQPRFRYAAVIAALIACALTFYLLSPQPSGKTFAERQEQISQSSGIQVPATEQSVSPDNDGSEISHRTMSHTEVALSTTNSCTPNKAHTPANADASRGNTPQTEKEKRGENNPEASIVLSDEIPNKGISLQESTSRTRHTDTAPSAKQRKDGGFSIGFVASNALSSSGYSPDTRNTRSYMYYMAYENRPLKYNHKIPFSFGLTVEKQFGKHWGIESGIVYTLLRSDYRTDNLIREGRQELHYLGVPLFARYRFFNMRHFVFYISAGPRMDFNIYGRRTDRSESPTANSTNTENIRDKSVQWSAHLKAGASYQFSKHFDLYAEPAVSYFINNGNHDIVNLWKDKPVTFSFHIGIRTTF